MDSCADKAVYELGKAIDERIEALKNDLGIVDTLNARLQELERMKLTLETISREVCPPNGVPKPLERHYDDDNNEPVSGFDDDDPEAEERHSAFWDAHDEEEEEDPNPCVDCDEDCDDCPEGTSLGFGPVSNDNGITGFGS